MAMSGGEMGCGGRGDARSLTPAQVDAAAALLAAARAGRQLLDAMPEALRPRGLGDAYAVQDRLAETLGLRRVGWFCACTNPEIQRMLGLAEPYYARLFEPQILESPATLAQADYPPIVLECEVAFRLGADLPPRAAAYERDEVAAAVATVHPSIEVVAAHFKDWPRQDVFTLIADNGTDGALVVGPGTPLQAAPPLAPMFVRLIVDGAEVRAGEGRRVLGDPLDALVWLANARARAGDGLRAGDIHNTGTATDIFWAPPGSRAVAMFQGLGEARLTLRA